MGKRKQQQQKKQEILSNWEIFLHLQETISLMEKLTPDNLSELFPDLLKASSEIWGQEVDNPAAFLTLLHCSQSVQQKEAPLYALMKQLVQCMKLSVNHPDHWEKRRFVKQLGLFYEPYHLQDLFDQLPGDRLYNVKLIERARNDNYHVKRYRVLDEAVNSDPSAVVVNEQNDFYIVHKDESVIFYSYSDPEKCNIDVELVVFRGVACKAPFSEQLLQWIKDVIFQACHDRRDTRPTAPGKLVQLGLNMGPRHARVLGWAKSFQKVLDEDTMISCDEDAVGALSIMWSLIQSVMPRNVLDCVDDKLADMKLPRLATRNIKEGYGFHIKIGDQIYEFPTVERAPPEAYLSYGYQARTHTDKSYCTYAFAFCADSTMVVSPESEPLTGGSSFVDIGLKVVVHQSTGTVTAFKPEHLHGTTVSHGLANSILAISFSRRVGDAWAEAAARDGKPVIAYEKVEDQN